MKTTLPAACDVNVREARLDSWPLPAEAITRGRPEASGLVLAKSDDARIVRGIWASTPGQFRWSWSYDETIVVVAGRATVELSDGRTVELVPGSLAFFERGLASVWTIHEPFRKGFHALSPEPLPF
jgi:uncharacterized cupin superfamily protein